MEQDRLHHTARINADGLKRVKVDGLSNELQNKIQELHKIAPEESTESPFTVSAAYLTDVFSRQADGLSALRGMNEPEERHRRALALLLRRKTVLNSLHAAFRSESFTEVEKSQLLWLYDMGLAFTNKISKDLGLFNTQYGVSNEKGVVLANITTAEMQQQLSALLITRPREASDVVSAPTSQSQARFLEEIVFPLFHTMAVRALGLTAGEQLSRGLQNGAYGGAAAYCMYSNAKLNKFGKSFRVFFPSPYLDAFEQTDLLLVPDEQIPEHIREEIANALHAIMGTDHQAINNLSKEAKEYVYKVQVKARANGPDGLTNAEVEERDKFLSARCRSKGFDNADYLVLNAKRAREIVEKARTEAVYV